MFTILDRYICRLFSKTTFLTLCILVSFSSIAKFADKIQKIKDTNLSFLNIIWLTILSFPNDIEELFPIIILISSLWSITNLERNNELIAIELSGISRIQIFASILKTIFMFLMLYIIIVECIIPKNQKIEYRYLVSKSEYPRDFKKQNLWIKNKNNFIFIQDVINFNNLSKISIYTINQQNQIKNIYYVNSAIYSNKHWILYNIQKIKISDTNIITFKKCEKIFRNSDLIPTIIRSAILPPDTLSILDLYYYINYLKNNDQIYEKYQVIFWNKILAPVFIFTMMVTNLQMIFGKLYNSNIKIKILFGISLGFLFYFLKNIFNSISIIYSIPASIGSILPVFILIIINLIIKK
ncbi:MAG: LPS export ABC transporter permease LptG [Wigglesworthia glossinidia]|nr:LPS export ABC transporter permease LptG [Wigglesworthia glossinidia]